MCGGRAPVKLNGVVAWGRLTLKLSCGRANNCERSEDPQPPVGCSDS